MLIVLMLLSAAARGQEQADADSAAVDSEIAEQKTPDPRTALFMGLIPGGGQVYNGRTIKALLIAGLEAYYFVQWRENRNNYNNFDELGSLPYDQDYYLGQRNKFAWRIGTYYVLGLVDAYVDAHLITFPKESVELIDTTKNSTD